MSILVVCPRCGTSLNPPDSAAGKQVRCLAGGCGMLIPVPGFVDAEPVDDHDDDDRPRRKRRNDDDDDYDRPRRQRQRYEDDYDDYQPVRRRRGKSRTNIVPILLIVLGIAVIAGLLGWGVYTLVTKGKKSGSSTPPSGWKEFTFQNDKFKAYFPEQPQVMDIRQGPVVPGMSVNGYISPIAGNSGGVVVAAVQFPGNIPSSQRERVMDEVRKAMTSRMAAVSNARLSAPRSVTWAGQKAEEMTVEENGQGKGAGLIRYMVTESSGYFAFLGTDDDRMSRDIENGFFDNFVLLK